jgi:hypothetical protein
MVGFQGGRVRSPRVRPELGRPRRTASAAAGWRARLLDIEHGDPHDVVSRPGDLIVLRYQEPRQMDAQRFVLRFQETREVFVPESTVLADPTLGVAVAEHL